MIGHKKNHKLKTYGFLPLQHKDTTKIRLCRSNKELFYALARRDSLGAFHFFKHFEDAFWRPDEKAFERFAKAFALKGIAAVTFDFCHGDLRSLHGGV